MQHVNLDYKNCKPPVFAKGGVHYASEVRGMATVRAKDEIERARGTLDKREGGFY